MLLRPVALGAHVAGIVLSSAAVGLGLWQLNTWEDRRDDASTERIERSAEPLVDVIGPDQPFQKDQVARSVTAQGEWLTDRTVYVPDRDRDGVEGHWVITMFAVDGSESAIPVVRGWIEEIDPRPVAPTGQASLAGWLQPPEGKAGMPDDDPTDDVIPQVRMADLVQHVDRDLYGGYLLLDHDIQDVDASTSNGGVESLESVDLTQVPEVSATTGWRNFLYAMEWWIFAGFALFIWLRWCRDEVLRVREEEAAQYAPAEPTAEPVEAVDERREDTHAATDA